MKKLRTTVAITSLVSGVLAAAASTAHAVDQTVPGAGYAAAAQLAAGSALVSSTRKFISGRIAKIADPTLRVNVRDLVENRMVCVRHRANETAASKQAIVDALAAAGLYAATDDVALAHLSAERLYMLYTSGGLDVVRGQLAKLRARGII
jgi:hypothetical protein